MATLKPGQTLRGVDSRLACQVAAAIGEGGQGEVYRVLLDGQPFALKWYNPFVLRVDRGLRRRLEVAIDHGAPSTAFLWPFELVTLPDGSGLGYLMRLRRPGFQKIQAVLAEQIRPSFRVIATLGARLTEALLALHSRGLVYQDLNAGNVFFDPDSGEVEICDNDNVDIDGSPSVMGGVWEFQAPEVVMRRAGPSRATDLHSLAVMLFRLLHIGHPLVGRRELSMANLTDPAAQRRLFGDEACFVYDPDDTSNRPDPDVHGPVLGHWAIYPAFLRALFVQAFTVGLHDPSGGRVQESEWRRAMRRLLDSVMTCGACGAQSFYDADRLVRREAGFACWHCGATLPTAPARLGIRRRGARPTEPPLYVVVAEPGARLHGYHAEAASPDPDAVVAELFGPPPALRNLTARSWTVRDGAGSLELAPGAGLELRDRMRLALGAHEAVFRA